ncbi:hypothetical protein [Gyrovirus Tu243]|uniref:Uncharacterized protein n=1 Tax=Gyrovirus Tu243 TaxID=1415627 RepID=U5U743_9VIRU|nr:hypothetical protein [Gyrovirus Tu243]AGZ20417.1 hypothetical protein [Gyrovirus Tu243]
MLADELPGDAQASVQLRQFQEPLVPVGGEACVGSCYGHSDRPISSETSVWWFRHCRDWSEARRRKEILEFFKVQKRRLPGVGGGLQEEL